MKSFRGYLMRRLAASVPVFVVLAFCLGCAGSAAKAPTPYIPEELGDFPVHPELEYKKGYRYAPQGLAGTDFKPTWTGHYKGPQLPENYVAYYIREMTAREWTLRRIIEKISGDKVLEFVKDTEGATIYLKRTFDRKTSRYACSLTAEIRTLGLQHFTPEENYRHLTGKTAAESTTAAPAPAQASPSDKVEEAPSIQPVKGTLEPPDPKEARQELIIE